MLFIVWKCYANDYHYAVNVNDGEVWWEGNISTFNIEKMLDNLGYKYEVKDWEVDD